MTVFFFHFFEISNQNSLNSKRVIDSFLYDLNVYTISLDRNVPFSIRIGPMSN